MQTGDKVRLRSPDPAKFTFDQPAGPWKIGRVTECPATGRSVVHLRRSELTFKCWRNEIEEWSNE